MKIRQSNLELGRIIAMIMILNLHCNRVPGFCETMPFLLSECFRKATSICAVNFFVLISGYFGIKCCTKSIFNLLFQLYFYVFLGYAIALSIGISDYNPNTLFQRLFGLYFSYWFIWSYFLLIIISPFLNKYINRCNNKWLIISTFTIWLFSLYTDIFRLPLFIVLYMFGNLLRRLYDEKSKLMSHKRISYLLAYFACALIITLSTYFLIVEKGYIHPQLIDSVFAWNYINPIIILEAICLFVFVKSFNFQNNKINFVAKSVLAIYLIHQHPDFRDYYYFLTDIFYTLPHILHYLMLILLFTLVLGITVTIDQIRMISYTWLCNRLNFLK